MLRFSLVLVGAGLLATPALAASPAPIEGQRGMVASDQALAAEVGAEILPAGGNAVDATVAVWPAAGFVNTEIGRFMKP